jgi:hypothetical protein
MKNKSKLSFAVIALAILGYIFFIKENPTPDKTVTLRSDQFKVASATSDIEPQFMTESSEKKETVTMPATSNTLNTITKADIRAIRDTLPTKQDVNKELMNNPHTPSKSLMSFAKKLGPVMEKAFKNEKDAKMLVGELNRCALNESVPDSARALCVQDTEKLSHYHPKLKDKASELRAEVSPEVRKILETNESFIKKPKQN